MLWSTGTWVVHKSSRHWATTFKHIKHASKPYWQCPWRWGNYTLHCLEIWYSLVFFRKRLKIFVANTFICRLLYAQGDTWLVFSHCVFATYVSYQPLVCFQNAWTFGRCSHLFFKTCVTSRTSRIRFVLYSQTELTLVHYFTLHAAV